MTKKLKKILCLILIVILSAACAALFVGCTDPDAGGGNNSGNGIYTVTFDDGTIRTTQTIRHGEKLTQPADPVRSGYVFLGWYTGENNDEKWVFSGYTVTDSMTLTARWAPENCVISFDSNGGSPISDISVKYGTEYALPVPFKQGKAFVGWFDGENAVGDTV